MLFIHVDSCGLFCKYYAEKSRERDEVTQLMIIGWAKKHE